MGKTIGRKLVDISQKARGRQALRYEFEVIPYFCGESQVPLCLVRPGHAQPLCVHCHCMHHVLSVCQGHAPWCRGSDLPSPPRTRVQQVVGQPSWFLLLPTQLTDAHASWAPLLLNFLGDIPDGVEKVLFAWERGSKLFVTDAENVNSNTHAVFWKQYLRQAATIYKENNEFLPKEFSFKVQSVKTKSKGDERKTVGKVHVDLAQFCTEQSDAQPQEVFLQLK